MLDEALMLGYGALRDGPPGPHAYPNRGAKSGKNAYGKKEEGRNLPSKGDTGTGSGRLVHLTEDQGDLGLAIKLNDGGLLHFVVQIVTLTGTLADTSEDGVTTVGLGDVVDELLNEDSLADTGTTEETNLSTTSVGGEQIDDLDTSDENLGSGRLLSELGGLGVDREELVGLDGTTLVDRVAGDVHDTTKGGRADRDGDGSTSVGSLGTTRQTLSTVHGNASYDVLAEMLRDLEDELLAIVGGLDGVENGRKLLGIELDIDDGTNDLVDLAITNTGSAGKPAEGRGSEVEAGRADGATSGRRRERRTACPGEGGNAALEHLDDG
jgi:hypothetical protein